jgi:hypothetical protein
MISIYPQETSFPVYHPDVWWGDSWNALEFGMDVSFERPFFEQWFELMQRVPRKGIDIVNCENSYYCNYCGDAKNCYLDIAGEGNEDCYFNLFTKYSKDCADCTFVYNSELMYESINCYGCQDVICGFYLENCNQCHFSFDLKNCNNCLFSSNLRHKKYHIFNKPVTKEVYEDFYSKLELHKKSQFEQCRSRWEEVIQNAVHRDMYNLNSEDCTGNNIHNSKNCRYAFNVSQSWDCKYLYDVLEATNCYDLNYSLYKPEASCELISTLNMRFSAFCMASHYCSEAFYSDQCENSSNIFGCIGLNRGKYCILNKQYSAEDYERLAGRLVAHMQKTGEWGEFFPQSMSPWAYHQTVAAEYYPMSKSQAISYGFHWSEEEERSANSGDIVPEDRTAVALEDVLATTYQCEETERAFKFVRPELRFYEKMNLPLPARCPDARHGQRIALRNPRKLFRRECSKTGEPIITTYAPEKNVKVFCEKAYLEYIRG